MGHLAVDEEEATFSSRRSSRKLGVSIFFAVTVISTPNEEKPRAERVYWYQQFQVTVHHFDEVKEAGTSKS